MKNTAQYKAKNLVDEDPYSYLPHHTVDGLTSIADDEYFQDTFDRIDSFLARREIIVTNNSRYQQLKSILRRPIPNLISNIDFYKFYMANRDLSLLLAIVNTSPGNEGNLPNLKRAILEDQLAPDATNTKSPGRDFLFEHFARAFFVAAGCQVEAGEPDWLCCYHSLKFGVAVKRSSLASLEKNIKKARDQIHLSKKRGIILLDVSHNDSSTARQFFDGNAEEYFGHVHAWMRDNVLNFIDKNFKRWKITGEEIPAIITFHFGTFIDGDKLTTAHHFNEYRVEFSREMTAKELYQNYLLDRLMDTLHTTLPASGITVPQVPCTT